MSLRVGLLSTARINQAILGGAQGTGAVEVTAVASRSPERARAYAREHGIARAHGSYDALLADPEVDAIYVPLPNGDHAAWSERALAAGKHVLCEKPMGRRAVQVAAAFDAAEAAGRVLMEAFMWRFLPQTAELRRLIADGAVGDLRTVRAAFGFTLADRGDFRWDPQHEGGAVMDVGCYCVSALRLLCGEPVRVGAEAVDADGVDARLAAVLRFPGEVLGLLDCGFDVAPRAGIEVVGSAGTVRVADPWRAWEPAIALERHDGEVEVLRPPGADPYTLELEALAAAAAGERPLEWGREDAVAQAAVIEALYRSAGEGRVVTL